MVCGSGFIVLSPRWSITKVAQPDRHARLIVFALFSETANRTGRDSKHRPRLDFLSPSSAGSSLHPRSRGVEGTPPLSDPACFSMASRRGFSHCPTAAHGSSPPPWEARLKPAGAKPLGPPSPRLKAGCKEEPAEDGLNVPGFGSVKPARLGFASLEESTPPLRKSIKRVWLTAYATHRPHDPSPTRRLTEDSPPTFLLNEGK